MGSKPLTDDDLDADAILELLETMRRGGEAEGNGGLRERKKRRLRQRISNVATALFLTEGILYRATFTHIQTASSFAALDTAVRADVIRALRTAAPALDAFDTDFPAAATA